MTIKPDNISISESDLEVTLSYCGYFENSYESVTITFPKPFYEDQIHKLTSLSECTMQGREGSIQIQRIEDIVDIFLKTPTEGFQTQCDYQDLLTQDLKGLREIAVSS